MPDGIITDYNFNDLYSLNSKPQCFEKEKTELLEPKLIDIIYYCDDITVNKLLEVLNVIQHDKNGRILDVEDALYDIKNKIEYDREYEILLRFIARNCNLPSQFKSDIETIEKVLGL